MVAVRANDIQQLSVTYSRVQVPGTLALTCESQLLSWITYGSIHTTWHDNAPIHTRCLEAACSAVMCAEFCCGHTS